MDASMDDVNDASELAHKPATKTRTTYGSKKATRVSPPAPTKPASLLEGIMARHIAASDSEAEDDDTSRQSKPEDASDAFGIKARLSAIDQEYSDNEGDEIHHRSHRSHLNESSSSNSVSTEGDSSILGDVSLSSSANIQLPSSQTDPPSPTQSEKDSGPYSKQLRPSFSSDDRPQPPHNLFDFSDDSDADNAVQTSKEDGRSKSRPTKKQSPATQPAEDGVKTRTSSKIKPQKIKKPTLREKEESLKEHARIMAERECSVTTKATERYTVKDLLSSISRESRFYNQSSDPIQEFTSSPYQHPSKPEPAETSNPDKASQSREDSDDEMPDVQKVLDEKRKREALHRKKLEALEKALEVDYSSESDLEIEDESPKKSAKMLSYEKKLAGVAGFKPGRQKMHAVLEGSQGETTLKNASRSHFTRGPRDRSTKIDLRELTKTMRQKASRQSEQAIREKEEEWKRRGGQVRHRANAEESKFTLQDLAAGLAQAEEVDGSEANMESGSEDADDEDYVPVERGSVSPVGSQSPIGSDAENEAVTIPIDDANDDEERQTSEAATDDSDDENKIPTSRHAPTRVRMVVSDSEDDDENKPPRSTGRVLVPETSMILEDIERRSSVYSEGNSDKENRENDQRSATDSSGDKENAMLFSPKSPTGRPGFSRGLSMSLSLNNDRARQSPQSPSGRRPLQERKLSDHDPFAFDSPKALNSSPQVSPKTSRQKARIDSPVSIRPMFGPPLGSFSQFFSESGSAPRMDVDSPVKSTLKPAFQEKTGDGFLQPSFEPKSISKNNFADFFSQTQADAQPRFGGIARHEDDINLTLETKELQPALSVTTQIRRNANALFEKEQEFVLEEAATSAISTSSKPELYMLENGMLTQTKPADTTPFVYRTWTPSQKMLLSQATAPPTTGPRVPLGELSFASDPDSPTLATPSGHKLTRLRKGKERELSPLPMMNKDNAFARMMRNANRSKEKGKEKLKNNEFVEGEAMESDDDEMMGFGPKQKEVDDDSDDDPNEVVEGLVDDAGITEEQLAKDKVLEKVHEQEKEDDAVIEKLHTDATKGKLRSSKRQGVSVDDSDSEIDENEEDEERRKRMAKKRRVDGDTFEKLGKNEKTKPYYEAHMREVMQDDNEDFAHLGDDKQVEEEEHNENENEPKPIEISTSELKAKLREAAQQKKEGNGYTVFDADDVAWADEGMHTDDDDTDVAEIEDRPRRAGLRQGRNEPEFDDIISRPRHEDEKEFARLKAWEKEHGRRAVGTGGLKGAITVTGHGLKGSATRGRAGGRVMQRASASASASTGPSGGSRKPAKSASGLAKVSSKHSRFG